MLPDIVTTRHTLLHNRSIKPDIGIKLEDGHYSHVNSMGHSEIMDVDGSVNDTGSHKALILKGHEHEVELIVILIAIIIIVVNNIINPDENQKP